jgi:hypothetical protein
LAFACAWVGCTDPNYARGPACSGVSCDDGGDEGALDASAVPDAITALADVTSSPREDASLAALEGGASGSDGATDDAAVPDAWKEQLRGSYALRIRNHSRVPALDAFAVLLNEVIWLGEVTVDPQGQVILTTSICRDQTKVGMSILGESTAELVEPEALSGRTFKLIVEDGQFRTEGAPVAHGYDETLVPADCAPGRTVARRADQVWIRSGVCTCPSSMTPPTSASDCRVTDPDGDGLPGYTIALSGAVRGADYIRNRDGSQFFEGRIDSRKRHRANYTRRYDFYQLGCMNPPCARSSPESCPGVADYVEFSPLTRPLSCAEIARGADDGSLFTTVSFAAPPECSR